MHGGIGGTSTPRSPPPTVDRLGHAGRRSASRTPSSRRTARSAGSTTDGRLVVRTSSQVPFLVRDELCRAARPATGPGAGVHRAGRRRLRRQAGDADRGPRRAGRAAHRAAGAATSSPATRSSPRTAVRHPMRVAVDPRAPRRTAMLTAMKRRRARPTPAPTATTGPVCMFHGCRESVALYRCPNKRVDAEAVYTNNVPSGAFRGYGLGQVMFAVESAMDELARAARHRPVRAAAPQRRRARRPAASSSDPERRDGPRVRQLRARPVPRPRRGGAAPRRGEPAPAGDDWRVGEGMAVAMIATLPPRGHFADARLTLRPTAATSLGVGTAEFGNGTTTVHTQIVADGAGDRRRPHPRPPVRHRRRRPTTPAPSARPAPSSPARRCTRAALALRRSAARRGGAPECRARVPLRARACGRGRRLSFAEVIAAAPVVPRRRRTAARPTALRSAGRWPSTCTAFRVAVDVAHRRGADPRSRCRPPTPAR